ncbi:MAG: hypothetical protein HY778_06105 [Betaproteobacteria bacterium]|nr:hypothetical protein [Betaproteobacteria bacterium]
MNEEKSQIDKLFDDLRQQRDELKLKIHLAQADARDEWEALETKWEQMKPRIEAAGEEAAKASRNVLSGLEIIGEEIRAGYHRIRERLR